MELIPAIDLLEKRCVRLRKGDFSAEIRYEANAQDLYARYTRLGARWIHVVDLDGARDGMQAHLAVISDLAHRGSLRLQVGGGLRDQAALGRTLGAGAARVVLGSVAATDPDRVAGWINERGPDVIVIAFDVRIDDKGTPRLSTHGWAEETQVSLWEAVTYLSKAGLKHVLCTDVNRDGMLKGPNINLYAEAVRRFPLIAWQASGGIRDGADLVALNATGVSAAISGRALLEHRIAIEEMRSFLPNA